jgi:hypothetical protein
MKGGVDSFVFRYSLMGSTLLLQGQQRLLQVNIIFSKQNEYIIITQAIID